MTSAQRQKVQPQKQYFFSPNLAECAGCGKRIEHTNGLGIVALDAPGRPTLAYTTCAACEFRIAAKQKGFLQTLNGRLLARARHLGAFQAADKTQSPGGVK